MQILSKREAKKVKLYTCRVDHQQAKEMRKNRKITRSQRKVEVRRKNWLDVYEQKGEESLPGLEHSRKSSNKAITFAATSAGVNCNEPLHGEKTFARSDPHLGEKKARSIASHVDQIVIVSSVAHPALKTGLIDRFLVIAEKSGFDALICVNKIDLAGSIPAEMTTYSRLGYTVIFTSALLDTGIGELGKMLKGKRSLFIGHSGVGKSSLLNAIEPDLHLRVGEISLSTQKGKHTTTSARLFRLTSGGEVIDCPGIRQLGLLDVRRKELSALFREFREPARHCQFPDCSHIREELCAVKKACQDGEVCNRRYESYLRIWNSLCE